MRNENMLRYRTKREGEVSASFLKKRSKKLLFAGGAGDGDAKVRRIRRFLLLFFKKEALTYCFE